MIEPSSGRPTTSGPGAPLLIGIVATAGLLVAFLIGFELGTGEGRVRTVIVGASQPAGAAAQPAGASTPTPDGGGLIQKPRVADELQQAYYANLLLGSWVVCAEATTLTCASTKHVALDGGRAFDPPASHWSKLEVATLPRGLRIYLVGNLENVWIGAVKSEGPRLYDRLLGVTLNGAVQFFDLGDLAGGDYVVLDRSENAFTDRGPITLAIGLRITPRG